ncbi:hypothetical protein [Komagataeibacter xylinus]|uniref:Uncharacterized protein n=1 Tax=Komagataeibacter xylinus TaxID=28448 RepID=A0A857FQM1_KOMXY|nr:hypothetical protein [Komagataeibacter xylinus]QHC35799.1 hypothetical protein FMA36_10165 [Komagataeibacter xylinus]
MMVDATINPLSRHGGLKSQPAQHRAAMKVLYGRSVCQNADFLKKGGPPKPLFFFINYLHDFRIDSPATMP